MELHLFDAFGIELEYMLVDRSTLDVQPVADQILEDLAGEPTSDVERGPVTWSNELVLHVIELKSTRPIEQLQPWPSVLKSALADIQSVLTARGVTLLGAGAHPWMDPAIEARLWPHEGHQIYATYDRIFNCRSHGWANVQSVHLNLPFSGDEEFGRLHAAVRTVLPLLPALAASSPILEGRYTGMLDSRMQLYRDHCRAVPSLIGQVIPEPLFDESGYRQMILAPIARDIRQHDPAGVMQVDFLNARGAIARFDRGSIEVRVMDVQEYPEADIAICAAVIAVVRALCQERWSTWDQQKSLGTEQLRKILDATTAGAETARIEDAEWLACLGIGKTPIRAGELWQSLLDELRAEDPTLNHLFGPLELILDQGSLATRINRALGAKPSIDSIRDVYRDLADCLDTWQMFHP